MIGRCQPWGRDFGKTSGQLINPGCAVHEFCCEDKFSGLVGNADKGGLVDELQMIAYRERQLPI